MGIFHHMMIWMGPIDKCLSNSYNNFYSMAMLNTKKTLYYSSVYYEIYKQNAPIQKTFLVHLFRLPHRVIKISLTRKKRKYTKHIIHFFNIVIMQLFHPILVFIKLHQVQVSFQHIYTLVEKYTGVLDIGCHVDVLPSLIRV